MKESGREDKGEEVMNSKGNVDLLVPMNPFRL
jgi:hypothetical protein